jgi:lipoprotein-anchoring transpeptidase ErfK/SrfK
MTTRNAMVSLRTAWAALGGIALLGLAALIAVFSLPTGSAPVEAPRPAPLKVAAAPISTPATPMPAAAPASTPPPAAPVATQYAVTSYLTRPEQFQHGAWLWNDDNVPAGPMLVLVDVKSQLIHVFQSGREVGVAAVLYGADDSPTPLGVHTIRWKKAKHVSSIFNSPMPYTLNLTGDGIAVHGSNVRWGWGTNGCIGVPVEFAKILFDKMAVGDKVVVVKGATPQPGQSVPLV